RQNEVFMLLLSNEGGRVIPRLEFIPDSEVPASESAQLLRNLGVVSRPEDILDLSIVNLTTGASSANLLLGGILPTSNEDVFALFGALPKRTLATTGVVSRNILGTLQFYTGSLSTQGILSQLNSLLLGIRPAELGDLLGLPVDLFDRIITSVGARPGDAIPAPAVPSDASRMLMVLTGSATQPIVSWVPLP
ncbi:MAG TPA: hypothetical protein VFV37_10625, partial [Luteibaculaceae bacterium]|nr:hypothetical protein [Luteibaculaceae bacterium]